MSVKRRLIQGSSASAAGLSVRLAEQLLIVPILLAAWPIEVYGEWILLSAVPAYFVLSDLGFVTSGSNELSRRASQETFSDVKSFFSRYTSVCNSGTVLLLVTSALFSFGLPISEILGIDSLSPIKTGWTLFFLLAGTVISQNSISLLAGLRASGRYHHGLYLRALGALVRLFLSFVVIRYLGAGPLSLAAIFAFGRLAEFLAELLLLRWTELSVSWVIDLKSTVPIRSYVLMGLEYMLMPVGQAIVLQGFIVVVGVQLGAAAVAIFATHRTLARAASGLLQAFSNPLTAEIGLLQRESDLPGVRRIVGFLSRVTVWAAIILAIGLAATGGWIFSVWTDSSVRFNGSLCALLLCATVAEAMWRIPASVRLGTNRHRPLVWGYVVIALLGVAVAAIFARDLGLEGIAAVTLAVDAAFCVLTIALTLPLIRQPVWSYLSLLAIPPVGDIYTFVRSKRHA